ncbi:outer membrane beta-barrel protein [Methylocystis echinoides]|uniref:outer membrane protein n=1 Tax=Methylocystis echinoides TaxID=29468 RepID=UPI00341C14C3
MSNYSDFRTRAAFLASLSLASPALGADLPAKAAPAPPPAFTWTGLYVGFNAGYTWTASKPITISTINLFDASAARFGAASAAGATGVIGARLDAFFFGGQIGYNWQFAERLIAGVEADIQGAGVRGGGGQLRVDQAPGGYAGTSLKLDRQLEFLGTARGRLGYAVTPTLMAYVTGGLAYGGANLSGAVSQNLQPGLLLSDTVRGDRFNILTGWTVGAGAEMALGHNLSGKLEYLYYELGRLWLSNPSLHHDDPLTRAVVVLDATGVNTRYNGHVLRLGLNYRFDSTMPEATSSATPLFAAPKFESVERGRYGEWNFLLLPYFWAINLNGAMTLANQTLATNATFIDALTRSSSFPLAFMGRAEAENGPFWAYGDIVWAQMRFGGSALSLRSPIADLSVSASVSGRMKMTLGIGEAGMGYELARWRLMNAPASFTSIGAYAGLRYVNMSVKLDVDGVAGANLAQLGVQQIGLKSTVQTGALWWMDPVVGLRLRHAFAPGSAFEMRGDIGGFGAGSKFSWQAYGGYSADVDYKGAHFTGLVGYRALGMDFSKWVDGRQSGMNAIIHGPVAGLGMKF